jgi:small subunit ribosomal protein S17
MPTSTKTTASTTTAKTNPSAAPAGDGAEKRLSTKVGVVESDKRSKTRTVVVRFKSMHAKYGKYISRKTVLQVHDENNVAKLGDTVEVKPCRPISKTKRWTLVRVVEASQRIG